MISISKTPYPCSFSKNTMQFEASSNMQYSESVVLPELILAVISLPSSGNIYSWSFTNPETLDLVDISLVAVAPQSYLPNHIDSIFGGTLTEYAAYVASVLGTFPELNAFYNIWAQGKSVHIQAKYPIPELIPINYNGSQSTIQIDHWLHTAYSDPNEREGYTMKAIVYWENEYLSNKFEAVANMDIYTSTNDVAKIDVSGIMDAQFEASLEHYPIPDMLYLKKVDLLRRYYVEFIEYWNELPDAISVTSEVFYVHYGGYSTNDELMADPMSILQANNQFLTWWPTTKELFSDQPDWIGFMNVSQVRNTYNVIFEIKTNVGVHQYSMGSVSLNPWETLQMAVGYEQRVKELVPAGEYLDYWEVIVKRGAIEQVKRQRYKLMLHNCQRNFIMYYNSFGLSETIGTVEWEESMNVSMSIVNQSQLFNQHRLRGSIFVFESEFTNSFVTRTVTLTKKEAYRLQQALNTMMAFIWKERWIPVTLQTDKSKVLLESAYTTDLSIEFIVASVNDRASFSDPVPKLTYSVRCGIFKFYIDFNEIAIEDYGTVEIRRDNIPEYTANWNGSGGFYITPTPILNDGHYLALVTIYDLTGRAYKAACAFYYKQPSIEAFYSTDTIFQWVLKSSNLSDTIQVDYGFGNGWETETYDGATGTTLDRLGIPAGKKLLRLKKPCFNDIQKIELTQVDLKSFDFQMMSMLINISIDGCGFTGKMYLNKLNHLQSVTLQNMAITGAEFGISPALTNISFGSCSISTISLEEMVKNLWNLRKQFSFPVNLSISSIYGPITVSPVTAAMLNGTGEFTGEGLVANYGWNFTNV